MRNAHPAALVSRSVPPDPPVPGRASLLDEPRPERPPPPLEPSIESSNHDFPLGTARMIM